MKIPVKGHGDVNACCAMHASKGILTLIKHLKTYWFKISLKNQKITNMKNPLLYGLG